MQQQARLEKILNELAELVTLNAEAMAIAEKIWSTLSDSNGTSLQIATCYQCEHQRAFSDNFSIDPTTFTIQWHGRCCNLGPSILFKFIQRLAFRPNLYYPYDVLMSDVWGRCCADSTIRGTVKRLRQALRKADMDDLAKAISGNNKRYGLFLDNNNS